jgi:Protein of unknown function (DUF2934)
MAQSKVGSKRKVSKKASHAPTVSAEERYRMIAEAAYYRAEKRGFQCWGPVQDWLAAEKEIDERLTKKS